eukprot:COSAG02_NODE_3469_length_6691_cov_9.305218_4_plen_198_part_00
MSKIKKWGKKVVVVVNKADLLMESSGAAPDDLKKVLSFVRGAAADVLAMPVSLDITCCCAWAFPNPSVDLYDPIVENSWAISEATARGYKEPKALSGCCACIELRSRSERCRCSLCRHVALCLQRRPSRKARAHSSHLMLPQDSLSSRILSCRHFRSACPKLPLLANFGFLRDPGMPGARTDEHEAADACSSGVTAG